VRLRDAIVVVIFEVLRLLHLNTRLIKAYVLSTSFCESNQSLALLVIQPTCHLFPHLLSSNYKSTQTFLYHCFRWTQRLRIKSKVPTGARRQRLSMPLLLLCLWKLLLRLEYRHCLFVIFFQTQGSFCKYLSL
jgi:hypothetical protein